MNNKLPVVTFERKFEDLIIFINGLVHVHLKMLDLKAYQSYLRGTKKYYIEYTFNEGGRMLSCYEKRETWECVLGILKDNVKFP